DSVRPIHSTEGVDAGGEVLRRRRSTRSIERKGIRAVAFSDELQELSLQGGVRRTDSQPISARRGDRSIQKGIVSDRAPCARSTGEHGSGGSQYIELKIAYVCPEWIGPRESQ